VCHPPIWQGFCLISGLTVRWARSVAPRRDALCCAEPLSLRCCTICFPRTAGVTDPDERNAMMIELLQELREDGGESVRRSCRYGPHRVATLPPHQLS
jgi:hypothetical protein